MEERNRDGVPKYDGSPEALPLYREKAIQYVMGIEYHKRYLCGPRLQQELTGVAKVITRTQTMRNPQWLSHPRGVYQLLEFLEAELAKPSLVTASNQVRFFYNLQRVRGETMTEWIARHAEALWEASTALRKAQKEYEGKPLNYNQQQHQRSQQWGSGRSRVSTASEASGPFHEDGRLAEDEESMDGQQYWSWGWSDSQDRWTSESWRTPEYEPPESWDQSEAVFIPEFLAGFLLLHRSGLEPNEKSNILAAVKGEFSTLTVGRALREQWSDVDLAKRDKQKAASAMLAEDDMEEDEAYLGEEEANVSHLDEETREAYYNEQHRISEALEAMKVHRTTLREARWNQKQMRLGRNYYPPKPFNRSAGQKGGKGGGIQCFRCGGPHKEVQCPKNAQSAKAAVQEEAAEIVFFNEEKTEIPEETFQCASMSEAHALAAVKVMENCMGIIDSGATASLGSIDAMF